MTRSRNSLRPRTVLSVRRSRTRTRVVLALAAGPATAQQLADAVGTTARRVRACLVGALPGFAPRHALVRLGVARVRSTNGVDVFELTRAGSAEARELERAWPKELRRLP